MSTQPIPSTSTPIAGVSNGPQPAPLTPQQQASINTTLVEIELYAKTFVNDIESAVENPHYHLMSAVVQIAQKANQLNPAASIVQYAQEIVQEEQWFAFWFSSVAALVKSAVVAEPMFTTDVTALENYIDTQLAHARAGCACCIA